MCRTTEQSRRRLDETYIARVNSALDAGRDDVARSLVDAYAEEPEVAERSPAASPAPGKTHAVDVRRSRRLLRRIDRYTLHSFNPTHPRTHRSGGARTTGGRSGS